jgi:hypothetical protein
LKKISTNALFLLKNSKLNIKKSGQALLGPSDWPNQATTYSQAYIFLKFNGVDDALSASCTGKKKNKSHVAYISR